MELEMNIPVKTLVLISKSENEELAAFMSKYVEDLLKVNDVL